MSEIYPFPPKQQRVIYEQNPLAEVICQIRFPKILRIATEEPAIFQEKIRDMYPLYDVGKPKIAEDLPANVSDMLARFERGSIESIYKFLTADETRLISLASEFVALTDKNYVRWESFYKQFDLGKDALEDIYKPAFYTRIGLRYKDVIDLNALGLANKNWDDLLNPRLIGLLGLPEISAQPREIKSIAALDLGLQDINDARVTLRHGFSKTDDGEIYVIDADFFTTERSYPDGVSPILSRFNRIAGDLFRWAISDELHDVLGPKPVEGK
ncbi:MAG: TIGR04255 family protein [Gemmatimonadota bacterium]|nr:TIGR04255 family protein [Gemmatimonadota bacterium]